MNYTDKFFKFPIKMYDVYSLINAEVEEDKHIESEGYIAPSKVDFATSIKACLPEDIVGWMDIGERHQSPQDLAELGFSNTIVIIKEGIEVAKYECTWKSNKFEDKLNRFFEKKEARIKEERQMIEASMAKTSNFLADTPKDT